MNAIPFLKRRLDPIKALEEEVAALERRAAALDVQLVKARSALAEASQSRTDILIGRDDPDHSALSRAAESCRIAEDNVRALGDAADALAAKLEAAKQAQVAEKERTEREIVAAEAERRAGLIETAAARLTGLLAQVADAHTELRETIRHNGLAAGLFGSAFGAEIHAGSIIFTGIEGASPGLAELFSQVGVVKGETATDAARRLQFRSAPPACG